MTKLWSWLSERCFDASEFFERLAIGRNTLAAYKKAIDEPTIQNCKLARIKLVAALERIESDSFTAETIRRCHARIRMIESDRSLTQRITAMNDNELNDTIQYHWAWDCFRTPHRYGLGCELHFGGRFLIAIRIGSLWISWGKQIKPLYGPFTNSTFTTVSPRE